MIPILILAIENDSDREFMITAYIELYSTMKSTAYQIINDYHAAEDIVHDAIAKLIEKIEVIRGLEYFALVSYISRTVRNTAINYYNKQTNDKQASFYGLDPDETDDHADNLVTPEEVFNINADYEELGMAIRRLPEKERDILYLKYNQQLGDQEIGDIMGIKKNSVREYLTRARRRAKQYITEGDANNE